MEYNESPSNRELFGSDMLAWHKMRGTQMIAVIKIISIAFDVDRARIQQLPSFLEFWGYILCPGNVIMGPWCSFTEYQQIFQRSDDVSTSADNKAKK